MLQGTWIGNSSVQSKSTLSIGGISCSPTHDATTDQQATGTGTAINGPSLTSTAGALELSFAATDAGVGTVNAPWTAGNTAYPSSGNADAYILSASGSATATNMTGNGSVTVWGAVVTSIKLTGCPGAVLKNNTSSADSAGSSATVTATINALGDIVILPAWCFTASCTLGIVTVGSQTATKETAQFSSSMAGNGAIYYITNTTVSGSQTVTLNCAGSTDCQVGILDFTP